MLVENGLGRGKRSMLRKGQGWREEGMVGEGEQRNWCVPAGSRCNSIRAVMEALITPPLLPPPPSISSLLTLIL